MIRRPPRSTRNDTRLPYTTRFRSDRTTVSDIDIIPELEGAAQHRLAPLGHRRPNRPTLHADPHRNFALRKAGLAEVLAIVAPVVALHHLAVRFPAIVGNQSRPLKAAVTIDRADGCLSTVVIGHCSVEHVTVPVPRADRSAVGAALGSRSIA